MKNIKINILIAGVAMLGFTSCLKKDAMNIDPDETTSQFVALQFIENGSGTTINSGMQYFDGGALLFSSSTVSDTVNYNIALGGPGSLNKDLTVTIGVDAGKVLDNYKNDSIKYDLMPDSLFKFLGTTATIKAGQTVAPMKVVFFPSKIDITKSYMLPVVVKDAQGTVISSNFATIYFHVIGNPIAGAYFHDYYRWNTQTNAGSPSSGFEDAETSFVPATPTSVKVQTGYYTTPNYVISFKNNNGVLSDFKVEMDKGEYESLFVANGVTFVTPPHIVDKSADNKYFEIHYNVYNGSAYRYLIDVFRK